MATNPLYGNPDAALLRKEAGAYLKKLRTDAQLTQRELADALGLQYYTLIAQSESGKARLPPDKMAAFCRAFEISRYEFA
jgi:transcriptional regulator with XRE-family HTH domain